MLHTYSNEFLFYNNQLLQTLKQIYKQTSISDIYFTQRCFEIILGQKITDVQLFGCGYKKIYSRKSISPYLKLNKIVIVANVEEKEFEEINEVEYLFPEVCLVTLQTTNSNESQILRKSPIRKALTAIKQINLNFFTYLDNAYYLNNLPKSSLFAEPNQPVEPYTYKRPSLAHKITSYRSFLLSYPKIYEYQLHYMKSALSTASYNNLIDLLEKQLAESLNIMKKHEDECKNFDQTSSPKIKFLVLNREIINDVISPLIYGYFYGPLCEEFINRQKLIQGADKLSSKGKMFNKLFEKDFDESSEYIQAITKDKTILEGPFETNYFHKAKHVIINFEDPSPVELALHISSWKQTRHYGENNIKAAILQQNIANRIDQFDRKLSNGDCISSITDWILKAQGKQQKFITEDQFLKLAILAQITGSLWFYHHSSLRKCLQNDVNKKKFQNFMQRRSQFSTTTLTQKLQTSEQQRSQLYRHEPRVVPICQQWLRSVLGAENKQQKQKQRIHSQQISLQIQFQKKCINNDISKNRQTKLVILIDGIVGYNQLAMLRRMIKKVTDKQVSIIAESYCNTQQYVDYLTRQSNIKNI